MKNRNTILVLLALALTFSERDFLATVITVTCPDAPLYDRVTLAQTAIARAEERNECVRDSVDSLISEGQLCDYGEITSVDRSGKEYRLSLDAVLAAESGCGKMK